MKANELRIGNWVMYNGNPEQIDGIQPSWLWVRLDSMSMSHFAPIELTPEILVKAGFETCTQNNDGSYNFWGKNIDTSIDVDTDNLYRYRINERHRTKAIQYLHQLQNLYYALTGFELEIKM